MRRRDMRNYAETRTPTTKSHKTACTPGVHCTGFSLHAGIAIEAEQRAKLERRHIERVLADAHGKVEQAAKRLGIPRSALYQKIKDYGLGPSRS